MDEPRDYTTQQQIEEFNQRLAQLAAHQQEICFQLAAERMRQDIEALDRPPPPPLAARVGRWIRRQVIVHAGAARRLLSSKRGSAQAPLPEGWPDEDLVTVVDAEYRVIDGDRTGPAPVFDEQEAVFPWES